MTAELTPEHVLAEMFDCADDTDLCLTDANRAAELVLQRLRDAGFEVRSATTIPLVGPGNPVYDDAVTKIAESRERQLASMVRERDALRAALEEIERRDTMWTAYPDGNEVLETSHTGNSRIRGIYGRVAHAALASKVVDGPVTTEQLDKLQFGRSLHDRPSSLVQQSALTASAKARDPNYKFGVDYGKDLLKDINQMAHTAGVAALQRDVLQRAYREIRRLSISAPVAQERGAGLSEFQRKLDASVNPEQAREYARKESERNANRDKPVPPSKDGFINDYD